ncbi:hypothetical protein MNBD_UNCLBAC01-323 [hydrothermal vent metagenome]|uniref:3-dehydroquinate dehydratase n=1 Tax=hydrothermal vent metagenome TaxID=652676 RepID=A0A3B1DIG6_9ZZZZ
MTSFSTLLSQKQPQVAVVITDQEKNNDLIERGINILEIRVDLFKNLDLKFIQENVHHRKKTKIPLLLSIRNDIAEGAQSNNTISDQLKFEIFQTLISDIDAVDIELSSKIISDVMKVAKEHHKGIIISSHNFNKTPKADDLEKIFTDAKQYGDIIKIAAQANTLDDVATLAAFTIKHKDGNLITMSLGPIGTISRISFPALGSLLTYSFIGQPFAPGQISLYKLKEHLKTYYPLT